MTTGAKLDQKQVVEVRRVLHDAGEGHSEETWRDVARLLAERERLIAALKAFTERMPGDRDLAGGKWGCAYCWQESHSHSAECPWGRGRTLLAELGINFTDDHD